MTETKNKSEEYQIPGFPDDTSSYITDALNGILKEDYDLEQVKPEALHEKSVSCTIK